jgi:hypothetical protein
VELVASLPPGSEPDLSEAKFVTLHHLSSSAEAEMISDMLRQNGIRSAVQGASNDAFAALASVMGPGAVVLVDERDLDRAQEVYSSFFGADTTPLTGGLPGEASDEESEAND